MHVITEGLTCERHLTTCRRAPYRYMGREAARDHAEVGHVGPVSPHGNEWLDGKGQLAASSRHPGLTLNATGNSW